MHSRGIRVTSLNTKNFTNAKCLFLRLTRRIFSMGYFEKVLYNSGSILHNPRLLLEHRTCVCVCWLDFMEIIRIMQRATAHPWSLSAATWSRDTTLASWLSSRSLPEGIDKSSWTTSVKRRSKIKLLVETSKFTESNFYDKSVRYVSHDFRVCKNLRFVNFSWNSVRETIHWISSLKFSYALRLAG